MATAQRNNLIDLLRFLAAISVVIFHIYTGLDPHVVNPYVSFFNYGYLGVPVFFIISGYCILIALNHSNSPIEFITRRFFRIFPPYWFSLIITILTLVVLKLYRGNNSIIEVPKTATGFIATFCLFTHPVTKTGVINWVYWTLPYEIAFYIIIFSCSYAKRQFFTVVLIIIGLAGFIVSYAEHSFGFFFRYWPLFSLGLVIFKLLNEKKNLVLNLIMLLVSVFGFYYTCQSMPYFIVSLITGLLLVINHYFPLRESSFSKLGDYSYSIYLIHVPLVVYFFSPLRNMPTMQGNGLINFSLDMVLVLMLIYCAKIMYRYIELPSIKFGKKVASHYTNRSLKR